MFERIFLNFKTTIGGTALGAAMMGVTYEILSQAGCDFSHVQWMAVLLAAFGGPTVVGAFATDNGKTVSPLAAPAKVAALFVPILLLAGCSYFPTNKAELESLIAVTAAGTYTVEVIVTKDRTAIVHKIEIWDCTQEGGHLTGCHRRAE